MTPSFNQAAYLERTIESVLEQRYTNLEYIVMDGGSTDGSRAILERYSQHISYWQSAPDGGQADAIASGFERATGEILGWLNSDDLLRPGALHRIALELVERPNVGLLYGERDYIDECGKIIGHYCPPTIASARYFDLGQWIPQETAFFRRDAYWAVGGLDRNLYFAMDFSLLVRLYGATKLRRVSQTLGAMRLHDAAKSSIACDVMLSETARLRKELTVPRVPVGPFFRKVLTKVLYLQGIVESAISRLSGT